MIDPIHAVTHIAPASLAEPLREMGATSVVSWRDDLSHGPVCADPKRHRKIRLKYWRDLYQRVLPASHHVHLDALIAPLSQGYLSSQQIGSAAAQAAGDGRIVVWTSPSWRDRLALWHVFDGLRGQGVPAKQLATAQLATADDGEPQASLLDCSLDALVDAYDDLFYPVSLYVSTGADLWRNFASASPRQWAIAIPHTTKFFPGMPHFAALYGSFFPLADDTSDRLRLSDFDRALLTPLSHDSPRSTATLRQDPHVEDFSFLDPLVLASRLRAWSLIDDDNPYVIAQPHEHADDLLEMFSFRLTDRGQDLLAHGCPPSRRLPMLQLGDSRLYAGKQPWVRVVDGDVWYFERFGRQPS